MNLSTAHEHRLTDILVALGCSALAAAVMGLLAWGSAFALDPVFQRLQPDLYPPRVVEAAPTDLSQSGTAISPAPPPARRPGAPAPLPGVPTPPPSTGLIALATVLLLVAAGLMLAGRKRFLHVGVVVAVGAIMALGVAMAPASGVAPMIVAISISTGMLAVAVAAIAVLPCSPVRPARAWLWYSTVGVGLIAIGLKASVVLSMVRHSAVTMVGPPEPGAVEWDLVAIWATYLLVAALLAAIALSALRTGGVTALRARLAVAGAGALILASTPSLHLQAFTVDPFALAVAWAVVWVAARREASGADADARAAQAV